ncbi:Rne/Rng family ribonuclease [Pengzhenrongella phosphoraccumulans]|uniref:Rne/Rng family ribonuclease n=1 Tax=Pengzhenrongella phosphoraccumulans TaxID=3114394 RepID=UPI00388E2059
MTLDNTSDNTLNNSSSGSGDSPGQTAATAPVVKAPRRRATRKSAAPGVPVNIVIPAPAVEVVPADVAADDVAADDVVADVAADDAAAVRAPRKTAAKRAPAKRASRAKKPATDDDAIVVAEAAPASAAEPATPAEAPVEAPVRKHSRVTRATLDIFAELAPVIAPRAADPVVAAAPVEEPTNDGPGSLTAILFQSADATTRPRRRRAVSPAGPPKVADETPADGGRGTFTSAPSTPTGAAPVLDRPEVEVEPDSDAAPAKRTSRRRGSSRATAAVEELASTETTAPEADQDEQPAPRRGGRRGAAERSAQGRGNQDRSNDRAEEPVADVAHEHAEDQIAQDQTDEDQSDEDDESTEGGPRRRRRRGGRGRRGRSGTEDGDRSGTDAAEGDHGAQDRSGSDRSGSDRSGSDRSGADRSGADSVINEVAVGTGDDEGHNGPDEADDDDQSGDGSGSSRRRRRRRRSGRGSDESEPVSQPTRSRSGRSSAQTSAPAADEVTALRGSTRLEAKRQRRREGRDAGRRRTIITESEFLARRESVDRSMVVREIDGATQIAVMEDGVLVEHYVSRQAQASMAGNVYLGRVQNVLPSMEAAFVDVGKGRNAVLYAGEVNWDAAGLEGQPRRIEQALKSGDSVLVQVTKDPIGQKGARLTSQVTLAGRYLVYVPGGGMTGISRKLPDNERARLKKLLREIVPDSAGVIVRTAAEGASEEELRADIARLQDQWTAIEKKAKTASAPALLQGEPDLAIRVVRDIFNGDFGSLVVEGDEAWDTISGYIGALAPDLAQKVTRWTGNGDVFAAYRVDEQLAKGMDRKVWLPSGGSLVIDRTEAMTVVDVNTGKFTGAGGTLEETVTRNNLEAAEEIVRQLRLRDIGGIIVIDFIDMVLESNRDLVLRRLVECLGRDRTKHQVAEVTSLGLVQMTRKRVGQGLVEAFSETCEHCNGRGFIVHTEPNEKVGHAGDSPQGGHSHGSASGSGDGDGESKGSRRKRGSAKDITVPNLVAVPVVPVDTEARAAVKATLATIAAAAAHAHDHGNEAAARVDQPGQTGPTDLPTGFDADETLELFPVAPEVFDLGENEAEVGSDPASNE